MVFREKKTAQIAGEREKKQNPFARRERKK